LPGVLFCGLFLASTKELSAGYFRHSPTLPRAAVLLSSRVRGRGAERLFRLLRISRALLGAIGELVVIVRKPEHDRHGVKVIGLSRERSHLRCPLAPVIRIAEWHLAAPPSTRPGQPPPDAHTNVAGPWLARHYLVRRAIRLWTTGEAKKRLVSLPWSMDGPP
jgi:hypothetical protein